MVTVQLTAAQALVRFLAAQRTVVGGAEVPLFAGCWAIFGHGNVAGIGEALYHARETLPTFRAHNEQGMALAAVAFAKAKNRRQMMACTTSIGPGAVNMVTAAGVAHVNRLPVLFLPGDVFANRRPDPVLQQIEDFNDATISVNDCFRPVSRWWDRITRPEQLLTSLPRAIQVLTDPVDCGPVTLAWRRMSRPRPTTTRKASSAPQSHRIRRRPGADADEFARALELLRRGRAAADRRGRRRAVLARPRKRFRTSPRGTAFRWPKPRPAKAAMPGTIRRRSARSASPAAAPPTRWCARPT